MSDRANEQASEWASKQVSKQTTNRDDDDEEEEGAKMSFKTAQNQIYISLEYKFIS